MWGRVTKNNVEKQEIIGTTGGGEERGEQTVENDE